MKVSPERRKKLIEWIMKGFGIGMLLAGVCLAYLILLGLITPGPGDAKIAKHKDTSYVKVINLGYGLDTVLAALARNNGAVRQGLDSAGRVKTHNPPTKNRPLGPDTIYTRPIRPLAPAIPQALLDSNFVRNGGVARLSDISFGRILNFCLSVFFLIFCIIFLYRLPPLSYKDFRDRDPAELDAGFLACKTKIVDMGNPRRIKRFSNKVRFHFYYLRTLYAGRSPVIKLSDTDVADMVRILLYLENDHALMDMDTPLPDGSRKDEAWFYGTVVRSVPELSKNRTIEEDDMVRQIFELNKNIIV